MNFATFVVLAVVVAAAVWAIRVNNKKGMCGYKEHCNTCTPGSDECRAAEDMVERMRREMEKEAAKGR